MTSNGDSEAQGDKPNDEVHGEKSDKPRIVLNIDAVASNADWPKRHWDLPTTLDEWRSSLLSPSMLKDQMRKIISLPIARSMPESLIAELRAEYGEHFVPKYLDKRKKI